MKTNPFPEDIQDMELEESICQALSLNSTSVSLDDLEACHRMRQKDRVIVKFSSWKIRTDVVFRKKNINGKFND